MDPVTIGILAAGAIGKGVSAFSQERAKANAMFGDAQEERLKELQRLEEMNALGLTTKESDALNRQLLDPVQAATKESYQRQAALMGQVDSSGAALNRLMTQDEKLDRARETAATAVMIEDIKRARAQEQEMRQLQAAESASDAIKKASWMTLLGSGVSGASDMYMQQQMLNTMSGKTAGSGYNPSQDAELNALIDYWKTSTGATQ